MEIERKFLLASIPENLDDYESDDIKQAYVSRNPTVRVRQIGKEYVLTVKSMGQMIQEEFELPLSGLQFNNLWSKIEPGIIDKKRYYIPLSDSLTAEFDVYFGALAGLFTVEVEFSTENDAMMFSPPVWFGKEVTFDGRFSNSSLSLYGLPK